MIRTIDPLTNDWTFGSGIQNYKSGLDEIVQDVKCRLQQWKGECFFALDDGVDYSNYLDIGTKQMLDLEVKRVILQTKGIIKLDTFSSSITNRGYNCTATVLSIYGLAKLEI